MTKKFILVLCKMEQEALGVSSSSTEANTKLERIIINYFRTIETNQTLKTTRRVLDKEEAADSSLCAQISYYCPYLSPHSDCGDSSLCSGSSQTGARVGSGNVVFKNLRLCILVGLVVGSLRDQHRYLPWFCPSWVTAAQLEVPIRRFK